MIFKTVLCSIILIAFCLLKATESKERSFKRVFQSTSTWNFIVNSYYNGTNITVLNDIAAVSANSRYYLSVYDLNLVIIFDKNWNFVKTKTLASPFVILPVDTDLYVVAGNTAGDRFQRTDLELNILNTAPIDNRTVYGRCRYNSDQNYLYVANNKLYKIEIYNRSLTLMDTINLASDKLPNAIMEYKGKLYVTATTRILQIENKTITNTFNITNCKYITTAVMDDYGYIAVACNTEKTIYVYSYDGTYTGWSKTIPAEVFTLTFDFNNDLLAATENNVYVISAASYRVIHFSMLLLTFLSLINALFS